MSIPNWKDTKCFCAICDKSIDDKDLIAVAKIRQVFNTFESHDFEHLTVGHVRNKAFYFHKNNFYESVSKHKFVNDELKNDELNEKDYKKIRILAGLE